MEVQVMFKTFGTGIRIMKTLEFVYSSITVWLCLMVAMVVGEEDDDDFCLQ